MKTLRSSLQSRLASLWSLSRYVPRAISCRRKTDIGAWCKLTSGIVWKSTDAEVFLVNSQIIQIIALDISSRLIRFRYAVMTSLQVLYNSTQRRDIKASIGHIVRQYLLHIPDTLGVMIVIVAKASGTIVKSRIEVRINEVGHKDMARNKTNLLALSLGSAGVLNTHWR